MDKDTKRGRFMRRVYITGKGPGWSECPKASDGNIVWGMTSILARNQDVTKVFEIHDFREKMFRPHEGLKHQECAREAIRLKIPYVVREKWDFFPGLIQEVYPREEVFNFFGTDFIGCSLDAMLALAIYEGFDSIHLYGNGQHRLGQYDYQLDSINFWLGVCVGKGVDFYINHWNDKRHTDILTTIDGMVYGFGIPQRAWSYTNTVEGCACTRMAYPRQCETDIEYV